MKPEDKELLFKDICARLPYKIICQIEDELIINDNHFYDCILTGRHIELFKNHKGFYIKPYLRPMSSMTEEERKIQKGYIYHFSKNSLPDYEGDFVFENEAHEYIDWLNKKMFDFRGLIPKGLALSTEIYNPYVED